MPEQVKEPIPGAGGLVFDSQGRVLLIRDRQGYWVFPKGHTDPGETPEQTARREVLEETGISGRIVTSLGQSQYCNARGILRRIEWFLMLGEGEVVLEPGLTGAGFFPPEEARSLLAFPEDLRNLEAALEMLPDR